MLARKNVFDEKIEGIRRRAQAARLEPWYCDYDDRPEMYQNIHINFVSDGNHTVCFMSTGWESDSKHEATAEFIAHSSTDVPFLLEYIEGMNKKISPLFVFITVFLANLIIWLCILAALTFAGPEMSVIM